MITGMPMLMRLFSTVLQKEICTAMALVGAHTVKDLKPEMVKPLGFVPATA